VDNTWRGQLPDAPAHTSVRNYLFFDGHLATKKIHWITLSATNPLRLPFDWSDNDTTNSTQRFYRVRLGQ
jgi:prepilin-type processing-associated H-X9-DG protein